MNFDYFFPPSIILVFILHLFPIRRQSDQSLHEIMPIVTFGICGYFVSTTIFLIFSLGLPSILLTPLIKTLHPDTKLSDYPHLKLKYYIMILKSSFLLYTFDFIQDIFLKNSKNIDIPIYLKYIIHQLFAPIFYVDIIYNLEIDRKNEIIIKNSNISDVKKMPRINMIYFVLENTLILVYMGYAIGICYHYYRNEYSSISELINEHKPYFVFQLLSCGVILFIFTLFSK